jgi:RNA polymerase sigma-70 factor, ECF subfamily
MEIVATEPDGAQDVTMGAFRENTREEMVDLISSRLSYFRGIALRRLDNIADAEDAVQEAFLCAWKHVDKFRGQARMSTWMTVVVMNSARMIARKRGRLTCLPLEEQGFDGESLLLPEMLSDSHPDPETQVRRRELEMRLNRLSVHLSHNLREVMRLRGIDGLSVRETANALGLTVSAVKARAARARKELRRLDLSCPARVAGPTGLRHSRRRFRRSSVPERLA